MISPYARLGHSYETALLGVALAGLNRTLVE